MDELPPLEHQDDPFRLLGVTPDVDERDLKRAYARKIKTYRPDRAPAEFALIHAAFEHIKMVQQSKELLRGREAPVELVNAEVVESSPTTESAHRDPSPPGQLLVEAIARDDRAAALEAWKAIRATEVPLEDLIVDAPPPIQSWIFENVPLTWRDVSHWRDRQAAFNVWISRFASCGAEHDNLREAVEMASDPTLLEDAAHDVMPAVLALDAVSFLAWRDHDAAERLYRKLPMLVLHPAVPALQDRAELDVDQAGREYRIAGRPPLPPHVLALMADWPILPPAARAELQERVRESLLADPGEYLDHLTGTAKRYPRFAAALSQRLVDGVPDHRGTLPRLPDVLATRLADELRAASRKAPWFLTVFVVLLGVVTVVAAGMALYPDATDDEGRNITYLLAFAFSAYVGAAYYLDRFLYRAKVRRLLAIAISRAGVTRAAAREWLNENRRRALRLFRFAPFMQRDEALRLVGMIAANVGDDSDLVGDE